MHRYIELEDMLNILAVGSYQDLTLDELIALLIDMDKKGKLPYMKCVFCGECNHYVAKTGYCKLWKSYNHLPMTSCNCGDDSSDKLS